MNTTQTETILIDDVERTITLSQEEFDTLIALYHLQFNLLHEGAVASLWDKGLLWSDCNVSGVKLNFNGMAWVESFDKNTSK